MGTSRTIHLGPFVRIPTQYKVTEIETLICVNNHRVYNGDKFCSECGKELETVMATKSRAKDQWDLLEDEKLYAYHEGETTCFFSNRYLDSRIDTDENKFTVIDHNRIIEMLKEFSEVFKDEIAILEEKSGQKLTVEFGFVYIVQ